MEILKIRNEKTSGKFEGREVWRCGMKNNRNKMGNIVGGTKCKSLQGYTME